jgi:hypothetical protein
MSTTIDETIGNEEDEQILKTAEEAARLEKEFASGGQPDNQDIDSLMARPIESLSDAELARVKAGMAAQEVEKKRARIAEAEAKLVSFRMRQLADIPPRIWYVEGMICPGFNMITSKKAMGKTFLLMQMANAIAEGTELLGRTTTRARVLLVSFELDERDTSERFKGMTSLSENAVIMHDWPKGETAFDDAERMIVDHGFKVIMFDTFLPMLPLDPNFRLNEYGDSEIYLKWRQLAKRNDAAIVATWHEGKTPREDFMLNAIGSTGMVAQADSVISIDRKRGDSAGRLFTAGNHAKDCAVSIIFENGLFKLGEGEISMDRLTPGEEKIMALLAIHPEGCTTAAVGLAMSKSEDAARKALGRLIARGRVTRRKAGIYAIEQPLL